MSSAAWMKKKCRKKNNYKNHFFFISRRRRYKESKIQPKEVKIGNWLDFTLQNLYLLAGFLFQTYRRPLLTSLESSMSSRFFSFMRKIPKLAQDSTSLSYPVGGILWSLLVAAGLSFVLAAALILDLFQGACVLIDDPRVVVFMGSSVRLGHKTLRTFIKRSSLW